MDTERPTEKEKPRGRIGVALQSDPPQKRESPKASVVALTEEQEAQAEAAAARIVGVPAASLLTHDVFDGVDSYQVIESLLAWMESLSGEAETITVQMPVGDDPYQYRDVELRLTPALKMTRHQIKDVLEDLRKLNISFEGVAPADIVRNLIGTISDNDALDTIFARLYIPTVEKSYKRDTVSKRVECMGDLTAGQMAGALYRFFTSSGFAPKGAIRTSLVKVGAAYLSRVTDALQGLSRKG